MKQQEIIDEIGTRPLGARLDRIDQAGEYAPGNICWSTDAPTKNLKPRREPKPELAPRAERVAAIREAFRPNRIKVTMFLPDGMDAHDVDWCA